MKHLSKKKAALAPDEAAKTRRKGRQKHKRSPKSKAQKRAKRRCHFEALPSTSECRYSLLAAQVTGALLAVKTLHRYPDDFVAVPCSDKAVQQIKRKIFPGNTAHPSSLEHAPEDGIYLAKFSEEALEGQPSDHPPCAVICLDLGDPDDGELFLDIFDRMMAAGFRFPKHKQDNRSSTPAAHLGSWHLSSGDLMVTRDTRNQLPEVEPIMNELFEHVQTKVVPPICEALLHHAPQVLPKMQK
jgi:hypothetical protein